jgi:Protein of unknown function (DUF3352)
MRRSAFFRFLAASLVVLLISIIGNAQAFAASPFGAKSGREQPGATIFVSKQAPVMVSVFNPERLQSQENGELSKLKTNLLTNSGIDYRKDVQPWLGNEITLAVMSLDFDRDANNGQQPGYLIALATKAPEKSREFLQMLFSKRVLAGADLNVEEYAGIKVISDNSQPEKGILAGAVVGNQYVLFANDPKVLREAINNVQAPDLNLTSSSLYQEAAKQLSIGSLGIAFLNLPIVAEWQGLKLPIQTYDTQLVSFALNQKGLLAETVALAKEKIAPSLPQLSKPVDALQYIPGSSAIAVSGKDLSHLDSSNLASYWQQIAGALSGKGKNITNLVQPLAEVQNRWGINLSEDIFSWVQGEYAASLISNSPSENPDWVFVAEKMSQTPDGISKLDGMAAKNHLSISNFTLDNQPITTWTELTATSSNDNKTKPSFSIEAKAYGVHTTIGNYEIFTSSLETMHEVLTAKENNLTKNQNFQKSIAALPKSNAGYVYLDWTASQDILERQLPILKLLKVVAKPFLTNLRSLTISNYSSETNSLKGGVFLQVE